MATTNGNRKILDLKRWEFCAPSPVSSVAGSFIVSSRNFRQQQMLITSNTAAAIYNPSEDGWGMVNRRDCWRGIADRDRGHDQHDHDQPDAGA
jgi:hypothetical protein